MLILPERAVTRPLLKNRDYVPLINFVDAQRPDVRIHIVPKIVVVGVLGPPLCAQFVFWERSAFKRIF